MYRFNGEEGESKLSSQNFIYQKFSEFYNSPLTEIPSPSVLDQREIAFLLFKERAMVRHKSFVGISGLAGFLKETVCSDVYHSCAYYENPEAPMDKKGWLGADLVFDIDADHIPTSCNKIHDEWACGNSNCRFSGKGTTPELCPVCGGQKFETKTWPCELCLDSARGETVKLIDMLENDFGFPTEELHVFFSGHRGYHVYVENEAVKTLDTMARKEIVDYVTGLGLSIIEKQGAKSKGAKQARYSKLARERREQSKRKPSAKDFNLHDYGWHKRLKHGMQRFLLDATKEDLAKVGIRRDDLLKKGEMVFERCFDKGLWTGVGGISIQTWIRLAEYIKDLESAKIDTVVTTDTHRLIRMNGTLHGKTGLKKLDFPVESLKSFDPFTEAIAFKEGTAKVSVSSSPQFKLGGKTLGPFNNETVELPTAAAVLLICKKRAEITQ